MRTVSEAVHGAARRLAFAGVDHPRREAMRLLGRLMGTDRGGVAARATETLPEAVAHDFEALVRRRERREPYQYLCGEEEFFGRSFAVDRRVLIPRPETELLIEATLSLPLGAGGTRVLDVGTGSGCIAVTLAVERPRWTVVALDRSPEAVEVARANAARHGVAARVELMVADFAGPAVIDLPPFDVVVSNPPYVSESEWQGLEPEVRDHEPKGALVPGPSGDEAYRALAPVAHRALVPGGRLVLELGHRSAATARVAAAEAGFNVVEILPDLRAIPRVLLARKVKKGSDPFSLHGGSHPPPRKGV